MSQNVIRPSGEFWSNSGSWQNAVEPPNAEKAPKPQVEAMTGPTRDEMNARLEAAEARVAWAVESMRAEVKSGMADMHTLASDIRVQGERAQANADRFYSEAKSVLSEIRLQGAQNKNDMMTMAWKAAAWILGFIVAIGSLSLAVKEALEPKAPVVVVDPVTAPLKSSTPVTQASAEQPGAKKQN